MNWSKDKNEEKVRNGERKQTKLLQHIMGTFTRVISNKAFQCSSDTIRSQTQVGTLSCAQPRAHY